MEKDVKKLKHKGISYEKWGYLFVAPFFIVYIIFSLYPMLNTLNLSLTDLTGWSSSYGYVGLANFKTVLSDPLFWKAVGNTFIIWGMNFIPQMLFALLFAAMFSSVRIKFKGKKFFKAVYFMPSIITAASISVLFYNLFNYPAGPMYKLFLNCGLIPEGFNFYLNGWSGRILVSFIQFWMWFGNSMVILSAGILGISPSLYESAELDGASNVKQFFAITLPLLKPIMLYSLMTSLVGGLQIFDIPYLFLSGGPDNATMTLAVYIYRYAFVNADAYYNLASAASVLLLIIAVILSAILYRVMNGKEDA